MKVLLLTDHYGTYDAPKIIDNVKRVKATKAYVDIIFEPGCNVISRRLYNLEGWHNTAYILKEVIEK